LPLLNDTRHVEIEEICIQHGLNNSGDDGDRIQKALRVEAVDPVQNVESAVGAERKQIMCSNGFSRAGSLKHVQLRHDGDRLEIDAECPQNLHDRKLVIDQKRNDECRNQQKLNSERVMISIVCRFELEVYQVDSSDRGGQEEQLHHGIVERHEISEEIQVTAAKHDHE